jgi:hypothetical protein
VNTGAAATVELAESYYVPWGAPSSARARPETLRLNVQYDRTQGQTGDAFTATVRAERVGSSGYGMLLAEIGLPPGIDVDRESLEAALRGNGSFFRYEIRPDRVVAYLWPRDKEAGFQFKFRARYGIDAQSAPSVLYDYYNPEEQVVQAPTRFVVR